MGDISDNFSRYEFECKCGCGFDTADVKLIGVLEVVRIHFNAIVNVNSGCRCEAHNKREGGSKGSMHLEGRGSDISVAGVHADRVSNFLEDRYPGRFGIGRYNGRTHIDTKSGLPRRWDKR